MFIFKMICSRYFEKDVLVFYFENMFFLFRVRKNSEKNGFFIIYIVVLVFFVEYELVYFVF